MKRIIAGLALAFVAALAHATTLNPVQLLNPAGSTSGQAIVSTGASSAPGWSTLGVANITGAAPLASPTFTGTTTIPTVAINGGAINGTTVGVGVAAAGVFTSLAAVGNDALLYTSSNALSVPNATVVTVTNWTKTFDRLNTNFNATTGVFTAPVTGYYLVCAQVVYAAAANVVSSQFVVGVQVAGSTIAGAGGNNYALATGTSQIAANGCATVSASQGQAITIVTTQNSGSTRSLSSANVSITRIP